MVKSRQTDGQKAMDMSPPCISTGVLKNRITSKQWKFYHFPDHLIIPAEYAKFILNSCWSFHCKISSNIKLFAQNYKLFRGPLVVIDLLSLDILSSEVNPLRRTFFKIRHTCLASPAYSDTSMLNITWNPYESSDCTSMINVTWNPYEYVQIIMCRAYKFTDGLLLVLTWVFRSAGSVHFYESLG